MTRGAHRRESHVQSERPAVPAPTAPAADTPATAPPAPDKVSPGWSLAAFLWINAFVALALFELLSALFRKR